MKAVWPFLTIGVCVSLTASPSQGQPNVAGRELMGFVKDANGIGLEGAAVEIPGAAARTDARGAFRLYTSDVDTITLTVRRIGYHVVSALLQARNRQWDTVMVEMDRLPQRLAAAEVRAANTTRRNGIRDFEARRSEGRGQYYTRAQIVARNTMRTSDVVREARGVRLVKLQRGGYGVRFASFASRQPNCTPTLWIDGQRARGMEIDDIAATDIEAMELYESWTVTPAQFSEGTAIPCGTIVIWTRTT